MSDRRAGPLLLDTCAALWLDYGDPMSPPSREAIVDAVNTPSGIVLSSITAWEVATLVSKGRLRLTKPVRDWFGALVGARGFRLSALTPSILIDAKELPGEPPSDPADQIVIASARAIGAAIVTRDRKILGYGATGLVNVLECWGRAIRLRPKPPIARPDRVPTRPNPHRNRDPASPAA